MTTWLDVAFWIEPFSASFMHRAFIVAFITGLVCALFSCFLVLMRWSLVGDALSHAVLPGVGVAYLLGLPFVIGAFVSALLCSYIMNYLQAKSRVKADAITGIVFSGFFAVGLVLVSQIHSDVHLLHIVFGNVLGVGEQDVWLSVIIGGIVVGVIVLKKQDLLLYCFDRVQVLIVGQNQKILQQLLLGLLTLTIVASINTVGVLLVISLLITPGATGQLLSKQFNGMVCIAIASATFSCLGGVWLSYHMDVGTAPVIVLLQILLFLGSYILSKLRVVSA